MNKADMEAVQAAKNKTNGKHKKRSQANAEAAAGTVAGRIDEITDKLADNLTGQIWGLALKKTLDRLGSGNLDEFTHSLLDALDVGLNTPIEESRKQLKSWDEDPKYLLPSGELEQ